MSFFSIVPREKGFLENFSNAIPLRVVQEESIETKPLLNINITDLSKGYRNYYNSGSLGISFQISIMIHRDEKIQGELLTKLLDGYMRNMTPLLIHTDAIDIPDSNKDAYIITKNDKRKQEFTQYTVWELEFTTYNPINVFKYANNNKWITEALKKAKKQKTKTKRTKNAKLAKCDYKKLKYSKEKKVSDCVKYMQKVLVKNKCLDKKYVDGWFGKTTAKAVKKFQKQYNKKLLKVSVKTTLAKGGVSVPKENFVKKTNVKKTIRTPSGIKVKSKLINVPKKVKKVKVKKLSTATTAGGSTTVDVKGNINKILRTDGKVDKLTWKALCYA